MALIAGEHSNVPAAPASAERIMEQVAVRAEVQRAKLRAYSVRRRYTVKNMRLHPDAMMEVLLTYRQGVGKRFSVLHSEGVTGITERSLMKLLEDEENTSREKDKRNELDEHHYRFELIGSEVRKGRECYRLKIIPLQKTRYLMDGEIWVDKTEFALVRLEGRPARNISFWVGRPFVMQDYCPFGPFWMPCWNDSVALVKFVGRTELRVEYSQYTFEADPA